MNNKALKNKIKEIDELQKQMEELTLEKDAIITEKTSEIGELKEIMLRQEQYMRSLGISLEEVKDQNDELLDKTKGLEKQNRKIQRKLGITPDEVGLHSSGQGPSGVAVEDRAPMPEDESNRERFVLLKLNNSEYHAPEGHGDNQP